MAESSLISRRRSNVGWNYASGLASILGLTILYPFAASTAGLSNYGVWVVCFSAIQLLTLADFGLGTGIVRQLSKLRASGDKRAVQQFTWFAIFCFTGIAVFFSTAYLFLLPQALQASALQATAATSSDLALAGAVALLFAIIGRGANSVLWANSRLDIERKAALAGLVLRAAGIALAAGASWGLTGVVIAEVVSLAIPSISCITAVILGNGVTIPAWSAWKIHGGPLFRLSGSLFVGDFSVVLVSQLPLMLAGTVLGPNEATFAGALVRVYTSGRLAISWLVNPSGATIASSDTRAAGSEFHRLVRNCALVGLLLAVPLLVHPTEILELWLGHADASSALGLSIVAFGILANAYVLPSCLLVNLRGRPLRVALLNIIWLLASVALMQILLKLFGVAGGMFALALPLVLLTPIYLRLAIAQVTLETRSLVRSLFIQHMSLVPAGVVLLVAVPFVPIVFALLLYAGLAVMGFLAAHKFSALPAVPTGRTR